MKDGGQPIDYQCWLMLYFYQYASYGTGLISPLSLQVAHNASRLSYTYGASTSSISTIWMSSNGTTHYYGASSLPAEKWKYKLQNSVLYTASCRRENCACGTCWVGFGLPCMKLPRIGLPRIEVHKIPPSPVEVWAIWVNFTIIGVLA